MLSLFSSPKTDRPFKALWLLLSGVFVLALQDSLIKDISVQTSYWQFQALRATGNLSFAVILAIAFGGLNLLRPRRAGPVYFRALIMTLCMFCFFSAAPFLTITQMAAGLYTYPLFVTLLSIPVLGERLDSWRIFAMVLGVGGAALVLSPWKDGFSPLQVLPIIAGFLYAANILTIRRACRFENTLAMVFAVGVAFLASGILGSVALSVFPASLSLQERMPFVAIGWPLLTWVVVGVAVFTAMFNLFGNLCLSRAYQTADASWLAPMEFSYLIFATFWGKALFDTWPTDNAIAGMFLIGGAGMLTAWREGERRKSAGCVLKARTLAISARECLRSRPDSDAGRETSRNLTCFQTE